MPTNCSSGFQRWLTAFLVALLVLPPGEPLAFARKKKKADMSAANESALTQDQRALHALNRLTFGPRPGDVAAVEAMGLEKWIDRAAESGDDRRCGAGGAVGGVSGNADEPARSDREVSFAGDDPAGGAGKEGASVESGGAGDLSGSDCGAAGAAGKTGHRAQSQSGRYRTCRQESQGSGHRKQLTGTADSGHRAPGTIWLRRQRRT